MQPIKRFLKGERPPLLIIFAAEAWLDRGLNPWALAK
jgi:hypothetical protein